MASSTIKLLGEVESDGTTPEPLARHHCPACRYLVLAPLGQTEVPCSRCGTIIVDERCFLELYKTYVSERLALQQASPEVRVLGYAEIDALVARSLVSKGGHC
jgi:hypothetical protein